MAREPPRSLHYMCNRTLELSRELVSLAQGGQRVSLTSDPVVKLMRNAENIRILLDLDENELVLPSPGALGTLSIEALPLPADWISRVRRKAESEPHAATRRVVLSKTAYALWNLRFSAAIMTLERALTRWIAPSGSEPARAPVWTRPAPDDKPDATIREPASLKATSRRENASMSSHGADRAGAASTPQVPAAVVQGHETDHVGIGDATTLHNDIPVRSSVEIAGIADAIGGSAVSDGSRPPPDQHASDEGKDPNRGSLRRAETVPVGALAENTIPVGPDREAEPHVENRAREGEPAAGDESEAAAPTGMPAEAASPTDQGRGAAPEHDGAVPDGAAERDSDKAAPEGTGRILYDAPAGEGLRRIVDGIAFNFDARSDAWMDETDAQHADRVARTIQDLLGTAQSSASEPWHPYLPFPASLETSRVLATAIVGGYTQIIGREQDRAEFAISPAAPLERIGLRRMLKQVMVIVWEDTPWGEKVMAEEPSGTIQVGTGLWEAIESGRRVFDKALASWIEVETDGVGTTGSDDEGDDDAPACVIDPITGEPRSRYADVAAAIRAKPLPSPQRASADKGYWDHKKSPLPTEVPVVLLGIGGSGKTHLVKLHLDWLHERYAKTRVFSFNASRAGVEKKDFRKILRDMAIADAEGNFCVFVCDEVQHLSATDLERLGTCAAVVLAGDVRQSGGGERVPPIIPFARRTGAKVIDMTWVWRVSNASLLHQISYVFYDSAFSALGRGDGVVEPAIFKYDLSADDTEVVAARCWAAARTIGATDRSLMLVIERDDVRDMLLQMAGSDKRQWSKGAGSISLLKPSQIQGREADVMMFLPTDYMQSEVDPARAVRNFLTLMGRARQEIWVLFTGALVPMTPSGQVFASLLRSFLDTKGQRGQISDQGQVAPKV